MATLRNSLLPAIDAIRAIPGQLGMRLYAVSIVTRTWTGARPGLGTKTDAATALTVDRGQYQAKVRQLTERDVIASAGLYNTQQFEIGPLTPGYASNAGSGGITPDIIDPAVGSTAIEVFFKVTGPGFPAGGGWFKKVATNVTKPYRYTFIVEKTAVVP